MRTCSFTETAIWRKLNTHSAGQLQQREPLATDTFFFPARNPHDPQSFRDPNHQERLPSLQNWTKFTRRISFPFSVTPYPLRQSLFIAAAAIAYSWSASCPSWAALTPSLPLRLDLLRRGGGGGRCSAFWHLWAFTETPWSTAWWSLSKKMTCISPCNLTWLNEWLPPLNLLIF